MAAGTLTDEAIEAFFTGTSHPGWDHEESLLTLASDAALTVSGPPPAASHALLKLFWASPGASPAAPVVGGRRPAPPKLRSRLRLVTGAVAASITALTGVGVAAATGGLPGPAQRAVARLVEAVTPFEVPEPPPHRSTDPGDGAPDDARGSEPGTSAPGPAGPDTDAAPVPPAPAGSPAPTPAGLSGSGAAGAGIGGGGQAPPGAGSGQPPAGPQTTATTGLDRAGQRPAAPHVPPHVPGPPAGAPRGQP